MAGPPSPTFANVRASRRMEPGGVVADRFEIERQAGEGGMGAVFRARDRVDGRPVAIKVLQRTKPADIERFAREARVLSELRHPAVVRYVAHGATPIGEPWIAMEWLEGEDLAAVIEKRGLTVSQSIQLGARIAEALGFAHERGVIHRDVKPSNILLPHGEIDDAKLLDFGIARIQWAASHATRTGAMIGTLGYMAPEQARGEAHLDARADLFSLGCVLFECLTGKPAFSGETLMAVLGKVLVAEVPRLKEISVDAPDALDDLVARMLAKDPRARPTDARRVVQALEAIARALEESDVPPSMDLRRGTPSVPPPSITEGEQRLVSVLVVGPTDEPSPMSATTRTMTPEQARAPFAEAVEALGGRMEVLADGSVLVLATGRSRATATDEATLAARCALAIRRSAPDASIALATAKADVSQRLPVGEVIDRAALLLRVARHDRKNARNAGNSSAIRIDESTAGLLDARFEFGVDAHGLFLRRERASVEARRTLLGKSTPCVGRERELRTLGAVFDECVDESVARAVVVTAPAGAGKSRLRDEVLAQLRTQRANEPMEIWIGRGDPISAGSPFAILADALRRTVGLIEGEPRELRARKLRARVARHVAPNDVPRVSDFLGEMLGASLREEPSVQVAAARRDAVLMGDQMRRAFEDFLAAECRKNPVVLVLDDLQWGDAPTVKVIDAALRALRDRPLMVLALARPELEEQLPKLWSERGVLHVHLGELTRKAGERLVRETLGDSIGDDDVERIVERAQGNAFFLEELIRAFAAGRSDDMPETVLAMVQARLEGLDQGARRVLRAASVFGRVFWRSGLVSLLGRESTTTRLASWLDELVDREVIVRRGEGRFEGEDEYAFRHDLVVHAAYAMLTEKDRALGHRLAGEWLEAIGEEDARTVAEHFERGQERVRAARWHRLAAEHALEANDFDTAVAQVDRALSCGLEGDELSAAHRLATEAHYWRAGFTGAEAHAKHALALQKKGSAEYFDVFGRYAIALGRRAKRAELVELVRSLPGPASEDAVEAYVTALAHACAHLLYLGEYDLAHQRISEIDRLADARPISPRAIGWVHDARASGAMIEGDLARCLDEMRHAAESFESAGDVRNATIQRGYVGFGLLSLGLYEEAEIALREVLATADRFGLTTVGAAAMHNLGLVLARLGRNEEALHAEGEALESFRARGDVRGQALALHYLTLIHLAAGNRRAADATSEEALGVPFQGSAIRAILLGVRARLLFDREDLDGAFAASSEATSILSELGALEEGEADLRLVHAEILDARGERTAARAALVEARSKLLGSARRLADPRHRASFLERVPCHARIQSLARVWGLTPS